MRINLPNLLMQAADVIKYRKQDDGAYAFMLEEASAHLKEVRDGKHTWAEFAEAYCLLPSDAKPAQSTPHYCYNCGEDLGNYDRFSDRFDTCGKPECEREARNAVMEERDEAHEQLDRDLGYY